jgi:hypothetical protein
MSNIISQYVSNFTIDEIVSYLKQKHPFVDKAISYIESMRSISAFTIGYTIGIVSIYIVNLRAIVIILMGILIVNKFRSVNDNN